MSNEAICRQAVNKQPAMNNNKQGFICVLCTPSNLDIDQLTNKTGFRRHSQKPAAHQKAPIANAC